MREVLELVGAWALTTTAVFSWLRWDEARLDRARLSRAWPASSKLSAVVLFGAWCLPVHYYRTRVGLAGWALAAASIGTVAALLAALAALAWRWPSAAERLDEAFLVACGLTILYVGWTRGQSTIVRRR